MSEIQATQTFQLSVSKEGGIHVVAIQGSLADEGNLQAKEAFLHLLNEKPQRIVVDLSQMDYISSSGIGLLVSVLRRCRQAGIWMGLASLRPEIFELFKLTRLNQVFEIFDTRAAALSRR
jgi:anti-sigma B factor antagonist